MTITHDNDGIHSSKGAFTVGEWKVALYAKRIHLDGHLQV